MNAKTKLALAILAMAFLVLNPIGACAGMSMASTAAHPCCPKTPAPPADCTSVGCACLNTPPSPATVPATQGENPALQKDPFADLAPTTAPQEPAPSAPRSWKETFFTDNLGFRNEVMSQFDIDQDGHGASRQSVGFEVLKKFSTAT